ncbi:phage tail protein [Escherichia coli]|uniref:phage tail protein n=1 Tax=Escherichia coli TaxID=562 RepID=UPI000F62A5CB|nr:phage tail protein [Escherichia coli]RRK13453.1 phage tail protein [Escherichia coli]
MATKYYAVLTNVGAAKLANATALGAQVEITQMAVGDGNGVLPTPNPAQTALVHELRRKPLNSLSIDPNNANQIIAEQVIPEDEGGWWIREIGLFDKDGDMIAVANCAETYKPQLQEGSGRVQVVRMILIVSSTAAVTLKIDPSVVLATRQYVDDQIIQVKSYVDQKMAAHVAAADPHKQYAPKESPALTGRPTAPTAEGKDSSTQIANTAFVQAAIAALVGSSPEALDTLNELAAALGNDPNFATTVTNSLAGKMDKSANGSDIENVSVFLQNLQLGDAAKSDVVQTTGQSEKDVISQKGATENFALKALLDNFGGATLLFNKSRDYSLQLSDAGDLSLYSKALDKVVLAFSKSGELQAGTIGFEHVKELKSAAKKDVGNGAGQIPDMGYFELSGIGTDNMIAKFPNRLIIQVFRRSISNSASVGVATINPVTFPTPFPGAVWGVFCTKMTYAQINTSCESVTNTGFSATTCAVSGVASATTSNAVFLAIGYA